MRAYQFHLQIIMYPGGFYITRTTCPPLFQNWWYKTTAQSFCGWNDKDFIKYWIKCEKLDSWMDSPLDTEFSKNVNIPRDLWIKLEETLNFTIFRKKCMACRLHWPKCHHFLVKITIFDFPGVWIRRLQNVTFLLNSICRTYMYSRNQYF